ncbi:MAG: chalcone isomerase family protein [Myxococcota bacterium]
MRQLALVVALLCLPAAAPAGSIEGVDFPDRFQAGDERLELKGLGLLRYRVVFRGYVAALYLDAQTPPSAVLEDVPKRLEIEYFWSIGGEAIRDAGAELLARNVAPRELAALRERVDRIGRLYRDVEPGDRYALTYVPGRGTELSLNGEALGIVPGADFAAAYFAIWLGEEPIDESLRRQLLTPL